QSEDKPKTLGDKVFGAVKENLMGSVITGQREAEDARSRKNAADAAGMLEKSLKSATTAVAAFAAHLPKDPARHSDIGNRPP
ncbi:MAG TPA: hypothetical protein VHS09_06445, partial [Polyangiaceae bacterium]|nr:hypothetical protein [Polyangiaceae bacterium]